MPLRLDVYYTHSGGYLDLTIKAKTHSLGTNDIIQSCKIFKPQNKILIQWNFGMICFFFKLLNVLGIGQIFNQLYNNECWKKFKNWKCAHFPLYVKSHQISKSYQNMVTIQWFPLPYCMLHFFIVHNLHYATWVW